MNSLRFLTISEAADILKKHRRTLLRWIAEGTVFRDEEILKIRNNYLINGDAIDRVLGENSTGHAPEIRNTVPPAGSKGKP